MPHIPWLFRFLSHAIAHPSESLGRPSRIVDPIDHPAVRRMSPRELADLPLPRPMPWSS